MKRIIPTLLLVLALVGYMGLTVSSAATCDNMNYTASAPAYTHDTDASGNPPAAVQPEGAKGSCPCLSVDEKYMHVEPWPHIFGD